MSSSGFVGVPVFFGDGGVCSVGLRNISLDSGSFFGVGGIGMGREDITDHRVRVMFH